MQDDDQFNDSLISMKVSQTAQRKDRLVGLIDAAVAVAG